MRKAILAAISFITLAVSAQTSLTVKLKDGQDYSAYIANVDSIVFTDGHPTQMTVINTIKTDTLFVRDTLTKTDTLFIRDTIAVHDTLVKTDTLYIYSTIPESVDPNSSATPTDIGNLRLIIDHPWYINPSVPQTGVDDACWQNTQTDPRLMSDINAYKSALHAATKIVTLYSQGSSISKSSYSAAYNNLTNRLQALKPCDQID